MKKLTIKTVREFKTKQEWEYYKKVSPLHVDYDELEKKKKYVMTQHGKDEVVKTIFTLEDK